jgi:hypothetical protein
MEVGGKGGSQVVPTAPVPTYRQTYTRVTAHKLPGLSREARYFKALYVNAAREYAQATRKSREVTSLDVGGDTPDSDDEVATTVTSSRLLVGTVSFKDRIKTYPKFSHHRPDL